jgi:hypothetical protein
MPIDDRWDRLSDSDWDAFADAWLSELRGNDVSTSSNVGQSVVMMNFTAKPQLQCQFVLAAVAHAQSDDELGHIAAGPMEHLLGWHGKQFIAQVEQRATIDQKFARMVTGVWKYKMADDVWVRLQAIQEKVSDPLDGSDHTSGES